MGQLAGGAGVLKSAQSRETCCCSCHHPTLGFGEVLEGFPPLAVILEAFGKRCFFLLRIILEEPIPVSVGEVGVTFSPNYGLIARRTEIWDPLAISPGSSVSPSKINQFGVQMWGKAIVFS